MRTILLVEADEATRSFCRRALKAEGYRVVGEGEGMTPDLVLCDLAGPGRADAEALRLAWPGARVVSVAGDGDGRPVAPLAGLALLAALARALRA